MTHQPTAAVLLIGDELLSGRTRDINLQQIAQFLEPLGIPVLEARTVPDIQDEIVAAVNALRAKYTYVFTTGGIGPTHDDITADAIAAAFGVGISEHPDALRDMAARYAAMNTEFTAPRRRMARVPHGASLVANPVSGAPGFQMENVFTLAGVPQIARAMLEDIGPRLRSGAVVHKVTVRGKGLREGDLAEALGQIAQDSPGVGIGSYPWYGAIDDHGVALVARSTDPAALAVVQSRLEALARSLGAIPEIQ
ncbi:MAG: competence/damage-inducible protein A [Hyphomonas sp.]|uniref:competence/damage-inducible protein A n=1 Tax=Hyphomonas sp. TaxID=87 RepID=UPI0017C91500|nr:molybdopterin-binding protein [Hyphomonas sp.]MBA3067326.1 competence/damage-inducible protein A [Hyphomonas sp.]MBU4063015.1 competence/damage-inducible protein A [Alphaproteobacteria bacterium]MBU4163596.1 competence/damage-inducible protein A [Alphaproteobacteria bacterium]MBU4568243.1 competence/damage-inducible protein A [Alphaproteobacteria bacterium]